MKNIDSNLLCPSCHNQLKPKVLACDECNIHMEGPFQFNEFTSLSPEDLHFLRIFIRCEGRVRDMEPALGLSYPTIRTRLTNLKNKLINEHESKPSLQAEAPPQEDNSAKHTLELLSQGKISFDEAMARIKKTRPT